MNRNLLLAYQLLIGIADASTGALLIVAPEVTLHLMRLEAAPVALPFISFIGAFVLAVGLACLYGFLLIKQEATSKLEVVWLLTAISRGLVAMFVSYAIISSRLEFGWITVALADAVCAVLQLTGLSKDWLSNAKS